MNESIVIIEIFIKSSILFLSLRKTEKLKRSFLTGKPSDPMKALIVAIFHAISTKNLALMRRGC